MAVNEDKHLTPHQFLYHVKHPHAWPGGYEKIFHILTVQGDYYLDTTALCRRCADERAAEIYHDMNPWSPVAGGPHIAVFVEIDIDYAYGDISCEECGAEMGV